MVKLGSAFSDNLATGSVKRFRDSTDVPWWAGAGRPLIFATLLMLSFFFLFFRLFHLTVIAGREYRSLSDTNRTRSLVRHAPRGLLLDRTGKPLVANDPKFRLVKPCENDRGECVSYISKEEGEQYLKNGGLPPGQYVEVDYLRRYLYGSAAAHVLGYTGELSGQELKSEYYKSKNYGLGDKVGRMGAEEVFNERLRGRDGSELVEIDASGKILRSLGRVVELSGEDITLSLDAGLSKAAEEAFPPGEKGAVIVSRPGTGEILALYSSPTFSPDAFVRGLSQAEYDGLTGNKDLPMFNRGIGGVYPPGSTFKIVTAIAGLETGAITPSTTVEDNGVIKIGAFTFPNWYFIQYGKTEGIVDLVKALKRSNDIFFYKAGEWIGITKLSEWAHRVGIGKPIGIELSGEAGGLMPDPAWKRERFDTEEDARMRNDEWYLGDTYHVAIGQGYLLTTPLAVNVWTNIIAGNGMRCRPTIRKLAPGKAERENCASMAVKQETIDVIIRGMEEACAPGGTGWPLFNFSVIPAKAGIQSSNGISDSQGDDKEGSQSAKTAAQKISVPVACKTGTAEFGDPKDRTHAWFTAFAPIADAYVSADVKKTENYLSGTPEISVTVLVEGAGEGSNVAAPIAKKIFEEWFSR